MSKKELTLNWCKLKNAKEIGSIANPNHPGVYIWGFDINNVFVPYYVGITQKIISRIGQHVSSILGGNYMVFHKDSLADFKKYKHLETYKVDSKEGMVYYPGLPNSLKSFIEKEEWKLLAPHVEFMIDTLRFSYAEVPYAEVPDEKYSLKEIEKICITQIGKDNLGNKKGGYSTEYNIIHTGDATIVGVFTNK